MWKPIAKLLCLIYLYTQLTNRANPCIAFQFDTIIVLLDSNVSSFRADMAFLRTVIT